MRVIAPEISDPGSRLARWILRLLGWRVCYRGTPAGCGVIIAYPHTSNWDFVIGMLAKWSIGIPVTFLGKDSLFRVPVLGWFVRWCGGMPVDRSHPRGMIAEMAQRMQSAQARGERWWLAMAPEGTRKRQDSWRSGFYHMAVAAKVPVGLAYFNYARREIGVTLFLQPTGQVAPDMAQISDCYAQMARGLKPEQATPVRIKGPGD